MEMMVCCIVQWLNTLFNGRTMTASQCCTPKVNEGVPHRSMSSQGYVYTHVVQEGGVGPDYLRCYYVLQLKQCWFYPPGMQDADRRMHP